MIQYYLINLLVENKVITREQVTTIIRDIQNGGFNNPEGHPKIEWLHKLIQEISNEQKK